MNSIDTEAAIRTRFEALAPALDEGQRRRLAAAEVLTAGPRSISMVSRATGLARDTIYAGIRELEGGAPPAPEGRVRRPGGGRKRLVDTDPTLKSDLERLIEPTTRGDPESPLRWTTKSTRRLAEELRAMGHEIHSPETVCKLLHEAGYSLQSNVKTLEGSSHPDRDAQFKHIQATVEAFQAENQPVISVDTKKKELVGAFKNAGQEWHPKGTPERVHVHDFPDPELGKAIPYGVYDLTQNEGWVSVGTDHDTAAFAVATIEQWWNRMGSATYPDATRLLITADGSGSNSPRTALWRAELQGLADATGLTITVCHFPPGTSKWNKIEHRMFSHISQNWRGKPLLTHETVVNLIAATTTRKGLTIRAALDTAKYPKGIKPSAEEMAALQIERHSFHGEWNYTFVPVSANNNV